MSEKAPNPSPEEVRDVNQAFDPIHRQAQNEWDAYLDGRPTQLGNGTAKNPDNGQFISPDKYFDGVREDAFNNSQEDTYKEPSPSDLARLLGEAEARGEKEAAEWLQKKLANEIVAKIESTKDANDPNSKGWDNDEAKGTEDDMVNAYLDHLQKIQDDAAEAESLRIHGGEEAREARKNKLAEDVAAGNAVETPLDDLVLSKKEAFEEETTSSTDNKWDAPDPASAVKGMPAPTEKPLPVHEPHPLIPVSPDVAIVEVDNASKDSEHVQVPKPPELTKPSRGDDGDRKPKSDSIDKSDAMEGDPSIDPKELENKHKELTELLHEATENYAKQLVLSGVKTVEAPKGKAKKERNKVREEYEKALASMMAFAIDAQEKSGQISNEEELRAAKVKLSLLSLKELDKKKIEVSARVDVPNRLSEYDAGKEWTEEKSIKLFGRSFDKKMTVIAEKRLKTLVKIGAMVVGGAYLVGGLVSYIPGGQAVGAVFGATAFGKRSRAKIYNKASVSNESDSEGAIFGLLKSSEQRLEDRVAHDEFSEEVDSYIKALTEVAERTVRNRRNINKARVAGNVALGAILGGQAATEGRDFLYGEHPFAGGGPPHWFAQ